MAQLLVASRPGRPRRDGRATRPVVSRGKIRPRSTNGCARHGRQTAVAVQCWSSGFSLRRLTVVLLVCCIPPRTNSARGPQRRRLKPELQLTAPRQQLSPRQPATRSVPGRAGGPAVCVAPAGSRSDKKPRHAGSIAVPLWFPGDSSRGLSWTFVAAATRNISYRPLGLTSEDVMPGRKSVRPQIHLHASQDRGRRPALES